MTIRMQFNNESNATASRRPRGHITPSYMTSSQVIETLTSITPHRIELELWAECHCLCLVMALQVIYNMIYMCHSSGQGLCLFLGVLIHNEQFSEKSDKAVKQCPIFMKSLCCVAQTIDFPKRIKDSLST